VCRVKENSQGIWRIVNEKSLETIISSCVSTSVLWIKYFKFIAKNTCMHCVMIKLGSLLFFYSASYNGFLWLTARTYFCFHGVGLGFELRALHLQSRCSTSWETPIGHFALIVLEMGVLRTICLGWPPTVILLIPASQVARITSMSHCAQQDILLI
jgi:hypothetical protein